MAAAATDELLRPLLEAAVQVARAGAAAVPSVTPPRALGPVLNFSRLPPPALATVRRVLDGDPTFRERVLASVTVEDVGTDGWLFLTRPDGWEEELAESVRAAESSRLVREEARVERSAARRVTQAEEAAREARRLADALTAELAEVTRLLADERRGRRASETEAGRLRARVATLEEELASGRAALAEVGAVTAESERLRLALDEARAALAAAHQRAVESEIEDQVPAPTPPAEVAEAARALAAAASAVGVLAKAVSVAAAELAPFLPQPPGDSGPGGLPEPTPRRADAGSGGPADGRWPSLLPPGVTEDSREAAEHLVCLPGVIVLVDGYNVTMLGHPELALPEQRRWLTDRAAGLSARSGADIEVVFDGGEDDPGLPAQSPGRTKVRVRWSPAGIEADDVLLDLVGDMPAGRPVVVVSNDKRVASGARRRGANVLSSNQLLVLLGQRA